MISVKHKGHIPGGVLAVIERMEALKKKQVLVGIPSSGSAREGASKTNNADLLFIHTNGVRALPMRKEMQPELDKGTKYSVALQMYTRAHGSAMLHIPPRPVIQPSILDSKETIAKRLSQIAITAMQGADTRSELQDLGQYSTSAAQNWFTNSKNGWAPNAESTIKGWMSPWGKFFPGKGSSRPLIDTRALRQSITFVVEDGNA